MAGDVELLFGVHQESKAAIEGQLKTMIGGLKPFKVKVELDVEGADKMIKQLRNDIKSTIESLDAVKKATVSGGSVNIKTQTAGIKEATQVMNQLVNVELEMQRMKGLAGDSVNAYTSGLGRAKTAFSGLLSEIESGNLAMKDFRDQFDSLKNNMANGKMTFTQAGSKNEFRMLAEGTTEYYQALNQVSTMLNTLHGLQDKIALGKGAADPSTVAQVNNLIAALERLAGDLKGMPADEARAKLAHLRSEVTNISGNVNNAGSSLAAFFGNLKAGLTQYVAMTFSTFRIIQSTIAQMKEMVSTAIELNDAYTQLQIVTSADNETMSRFGSTMAQTAKDMSASITDLVNMATVYSRLGYSLEESHDLAKFTAMLQNVGDIDPSAASDAVTAIVKAYGKGVEDIESIMDKMVKVGNNFPISVSQIAEGMNNASSMMAQSGMTIDQSIAMLTAANTTVQNISKSSTGLRTIIARLRNVKTEIEETGEVWNEAKYQELIDALTSGGVQLQEATGALRNPFEVLSDLADKWSTLSTDVKAAITTALAGTRQQDVFSSLMGQFGEATGAMEAMADSAGALEGAYDVFLDSMTAHINTFKAALQELSRTAIDSGFVNSIVDIGTNVLELLEPIAGAIGHITSALGPLGTAIAGLGIGVLIHNFGSSNEFAHDGCEPIVA